MATTECSICAEIKLPVKLCSCNNQSDKQICEDCAVRIHSGCNIATCNCFGFQCSFCRQRDNTHRVWTDNSVLYWKTRATDLADRLELCAERLDNHAVEMAQVVLQSFPQEQNSFHNFSN